MRCPTVSLASAVILTIGACTDPTQPAGQAVDRIGGPLADAQIIRIEQGGFDDANNVGSVPGTQWTPSPWSFLPNSGQGFDDDPCVVNGNCRVGDLRLSWGNLGNSPFGDGNPDPNGGPSSSFGVLSNLNFISFDNVPLVTLESGIQDFLVFPPPNPNVALEYRIDAAFGSGQINTGPDHNDFAVLEIVSGSVVTELLRWSRNDLQPGGTGSTTARQRLDCGTVTIGGGTHSYPLCTDWERHIIPADQFAGQSVIVRIRILQGGIDNDISSFLAIDNTALLGYDIFDVTTQILTANRLTNTFVEVAIHGSANVPAIAIDAGTLTFGGVAIARLSNGTPLSNVHDVNGDGVLDLIGRFDRATVIAQNALPNGATTLPLAGLLTDRSRIRGSATLVVP